MAFIKFPAKRWEDTLPDANVEGCDLVSRLVRYQSTDRMAAAEVRNQCSGMIYLTWRY